MLLVKQEVGGRAFLLQFQEIMREFGSVIPWLREAHALHFATNGRYFKEQLHERIGCPQGTIVPYQLVSPDRSRDFVGSILHFSSTPENFQDPACEKLRHELVSRGAAYITCLQVREVKRGSGHGKEIIIRCIGRILREWPVVWAVCEPELAIWYASLGATILSRGDNADHLAVISWEQ